jgi:hypothetical protein
MGLQSERHRAEVGLELFASDDAKNRKTRLLANDKALYEGLWQAMASEAPPARSRAFMRGLLRDDDPVRADVRRGALR